MLYISEGGGLTGSVEPGVDGHWIPCDGNPDADVDADVDADILEDVKADSIPSIGVVATMVGIFAAAAFARRIEHHS